MATIHFLRHKPSLIGLLLAVAVLALFMAWGHSFSSRAGAVTPPTGAMELTVKSGAVPCPPGSTAEFCAFKGQAFLLSVDLTKANVGGYIGIQTEIDYGALVYKPAVTGALEIVWPCAAFCLRSPAAPTGVEGLVNHGGATGSTPPFPPITYTGNLVEISLNCTAGESTGNVIDLVPLGPGNTNGSGLKPSSGPDIPLSDSITVDCFQVATATPPPPTATPPDFPQMQKLCAAKGAPNASTGSAQCNLFLTRQGTKIPPLTCAGGNNAATFEERLSIPIPIIRDPKDPSENQQLGAFEFEVHFDNSKVCVNIVPSTAAANMLCIIEDKDSSSLEGVARIGCVTLGKTGFPDTTTKAGRHLADVVVRPQPDVYSQAKPNQDNGVVVQLNNVLCELADLQGHPIPLFSCEDADLTIRYLEGDVSPDCSVNALDAQAIAFRWGVEKGSLIYTEFMNLEPSGTQADNDIDIKDLQFVFGRFGSTCKLPHPPQGAVNLNVPPSCTVAIAGQSLSPTAPGKPAKPDKGAPKSIGQGSTMNVGQLVTFTATVTGGTAPFTYEWTVDGETVTARILKDYDETVSKGFKPTTMAAGDFQQEKIAFYWKPLANQIHPQNAGPQDRKVKVKITAADGTCEHQATIKVERNTTDKNKQAGDFYTLVHDGPVNPHRVVNEHKAWHDDHPIFDVAAAAHDGSKFFKFHRQYIERFQQWRAEFGYGEFFTWDPKDVPPANDTATGENIEHPRNGNYDPTLDCGGTCAKPKWFTLGGGPDARPGLGGRFPCDTGADQKSLKGAVAPGFPSLKLLGCVVEAGWHGDVHVAVGGSTGLYNPDTAPKDPLFWPWHKFVDGIYKDWLSSPPEVVAQSPFQDHFIGTLPSVDVTFSEPVTGVAAAGLTVNGSPATGVAGSGEGPYLFTGFTSPGLGPVSVSLAAGSIVDINESLPFAGDSWTYTLINPALDADNDGLNDGEEAEHIFTDPTNADSDGDGMPDGFEDASRCLHALQNQAHQHDFLGNPIAGDTDADDDGLTDLQEFQQASDPCSFTFVQAIRTGHDGYILAGNDDSWTGPVPLGAALGSFDTSFGAAASLRRSRGGPVARMASLRLAAVSRPVGRLA